MKKILLSLIFISNTFSQLTDAQDVNEYDKYGDTPLHAAIRDYDINRVISLLRNPLIEVNKRTRSIGKPPRSNSSNKDIMPTYSPLELARLYNFELAIEKIAQHSRVNLKGILINAALYSRPEVLQTLLNLKNSEIDSQKEEAIQKLKEAIQKLVEQIQSKYDANTDYKAMKIALKQKLKLIENDRYDKDFQPKPNLQAPWRKNLKIQIQFAKSTCYNVDQFSCQNHSELKFKSFGSRLNHCIAKAEFCESHNYFTNPNAQDKNGNTRLHLAILKRNLTETTRFIKDGKINLDIQNNDGLRPEDLAIQSQDENFINLFLTIRQKTSSDSNNASSSTQAIEDVEDDSQYYY